MDDAGVVIVGAGHAGDAAAAHLRQYGYKGKVTLLGAEPFVPYHRPPLSKAWLKGAATEAELALRAADFHTKQDIGLRLGATVTSIDRTARRVVLAGGESLPYGHLILATGARARELPVPGGGLAHALRTRADADRLRLALGPGKRLVLVGGGYIGLEIAASARALGAHVTVLEREARLLPRVASAALADFFLAHHRAEGVEIRLGVTPEAVLAEGARLADGEVLAADAMLAGIGAVPNTEPAAAAGLDCSDGVVVDSAARTSDPAIFAIGDCTYRPVPAYGTRLRLESVPSALEQARQAASAIAGRKVPAADVPWFWSDQYDIRLQIAGLLLDVADTVVRGDVTAGSFALFHLRADGSMAAVEAMNAPESFAAGRMLIARHTLLDREKLADPAVPLRDVGA